MGGASTIPTAAGNRARGGPLDSSRRGLAVACVQCDPARRLRPVVARMHCWSLERVSVRDPGSAPVSAGRRRYGATRLRPGGVGGGASSGAMPTAARRAPSGVRRVELPFTRASVRVGNSGWWPRPLPVEPRQIQSARWTPSGAQLERVVFVAPTGQPGDAERTRAVSLRRSATLTGPGALRGCRGGRFGGCQVPRDERTTPRSARIRVASAPGSTIGEARLRSPSRRRFGGDSR